mmetsp:Transcript_28070/g.73610  ORF Transcript_28070/g.73610 Transcript_28070/m.73610 type:complete len:506 (+) Transcript_28070:143-1660(+)
MADGAGAAAAAVPSPQPDTFPPDPAGYKLGVLLASPQDGVEYWTATTVTGEVRVVVRQVTDAVLFGEDEGEHSYGRAAHALQLAHMLRFPGIWQHHTAFVAAERLWVVQPRSIGSLHGVVVRLGRQRFSEGTIAYITKQLLLSLEYMHCRGYIHRAVSSHSVELFKDGTVKLGGLHHSVQQPPNAGAACHDFVRDEQQVPWAAPEYLRQDLLGYSEKIDIYSVGVLVLELLLGRHPYYGMLSTEVLLLKLNDERGPIGLVKSYLQLSRSCSDFLRACLHEDDFSRPSAKLLLTMPFIRQSRRIPQELVTATASLPDIEDESYEAPDPEVVDVESRYDELLERWQMDVTPKSFPAMHSTGLRYVPLDGRPADGWATASVHDEASAMAPAEDMLSEVLPVEGGRPAAALDGDFEAEIPADLLSGGRLHFHDGGTGRRKSSLDTIISDEADAPDAQDVGADAADAEAREGLAEAADADAGKSVVADGTDGSGKVTVGAAAEPAKGTVK